MGGGILALAGVAFATAGPSALVAPALNGVIGLLAALPNDTEQTANPECARLLSTIPCAGVILRAPRGWRMEHAWRLLIPLAGQGRHGPLRARLLGSLRRVGPVQAAYLRVLPDSAGDETERCTHEALRVRAEDALLGRADRVVRRGSDAAAVILEQATACDLRVLGLCTTWNRSAACWVISCSGLTRRRTARC